MQTFFKTLNGEHKVRQAYQLLLDRWPVEHDQLFVPTRLGETHVLICGPDKGSTLVLLHGSGSNSARWMSEAAKWSESHRVIVIDIVGEPGLSSPMRPDFESSGYADWLVDLFDEVGLSQVHLLGESLGGWVALDFAIRQPGRVCSLSLFCPAGIGPMKSTSLLLKTLPLMMLGSWGRRKALEIALGQHPVKAGSMSSEQWAFFELVWREFRPRREKLPIRTDGELSGLSMPVLLVMGMRDAMIDAAETAARLKAHAQNVSIHMLPGAGHLLPNQVERVARFLSHADTQE